MQALLLAGGRGNRVDELTRDRNKCMLSLLGRPLIWHNLTHLRDAGVEETVIVVGYRAEEIINEFGIDFRGMRIRYVIQHEQKGVIHALQCAENELKGDFVMAMADEVHVRPDVAGLLDAFRSRNAMAVCGMVVQPDRERIKATYTVIPMGQRVIRLIEKPLTTINDLMGTGLCVFKHEMLANLERTPINPYRGEKEFPDWIQCVIDGGEIVEYFLISQGYININYRSDLENATALLEREGAGAEAGEATALGAAAT